MVMFGRDPEEVAAWEVEARAHDRAAEAAQKAVRRMPCPAVDRHTLALCAPSCIGRRHTPGSCTQCVVVPVLMCLCACAPL